MHHLEITIKITSLLTAKELELQAKNCEKSLQYQWEGEGVDKSTFPPFLDLEEGGLVGLIS